MFNKKEGEIQEGEPETIIGPSVKVEGDFYGQGNVVVEGAVIGTLKTNKNLQVGANAKIEADIEAENVLVAGEITGNLQIKDRTELKSTAKITGDIFTKIISIESGAVLNGKCVSGQGQENPSDIKDGLKIKNKINPKKPETW